MSDKPLISTVKAMTREMRMLAVGGQGDADIWIPVAQIAARANLQVGVALEKLNQLAMSGEVAIEGRDFESVAGDKDPSRKNVPCVKLSPI